MAIQRATKSKQCPWILWSEFGAIAGDGFGVGGAKLGDELRDECVERVRIGRKQMRSSLKPDVTCYPISCCCAATA